jgi:2-amino-4-hydroxy-6-hydroxymethyldihydropteridine diphosphokinase
MQPRPRDNRDDRAAVAGGDAEGSAVLWQSVYVGVGSNLDDPRLQVHRALHRLAQLPATRLMRQSALYGSRPWGFAQQPDFVNAVAALLTQLPVGEFFEALQALQTRLGHVPPAVRYGPRCIDLDLLVFDQIRLQTPELTLPHPGVVTRNFVLYPLFEVAPDLRIPGGLRVPELLRRVDCSGLWRLDNQPIPHDP